MAHKNHVAGAVCGSVIYEQFYFLHVVFCRISLLCDNVAKCGEYDGIHSPCVIEQSADNFLDISFLWRTKEQGVVCIRYILGLYPVDRFDMGVRLILKFSWLVVVETHEDINNIGKHGEVHFVVVVVPIQIQSNVAWRWSSVR